MKKYNCLLFVLFFVLVMGCKEKDTTFLITEKSVGPLTDEIQISELEKVFASDSIVRDTVTSKITSGSKKIRIYEKGGKHLLTLTPSTDSIPTVEIVRIFDPRYQTEKGFGLKSTFGDIQKQYSIKKIVTTLNSIVIFPKESSLYFTIDKEELPASLRYITSNIEAVQIPESAKIKYLMLGWE